MIKKSIYSFLFITLFLLVGTNVFAKDISLAWEPSDDPDVAGYRIYYNINTSSLPFNGTGASEGASPIDVGQNLTTTLSGLQEGQIIYFAVTAYNSLGEESSFSNVVASEWIPEIYAPGNEASVDRRQVVFNWSPAPTGNGVSYTLVYGTDPQLRAPDLASTFSAGNTLLAGAAFFGLFAAALPARRKRQATILLILAGALFVLVGCGGGGGGGSDSAPAPISDGSESVTGATAVSGITGTSYTAENLEAKTTYYWKVVAVDAEGQSRESATGSFTTGD